MKGKVLIKKAEICGDWSHQCQPGRAHCPHASMNQHSIAHHRDDVCCYCGAVRCVTLMSQPAAPPEHGPHYPIGEL